jgi:hypothetical protein
MNDLLMGIIYFSFSVAAIGAAFAFIGMSSLEKKPIFGAIIGVIGLGVMGAGGLGGTYAMSGSIQLIESNKNVTPQQEAVPNNGATDK